MSTGILVQNDSGKVLISENINGLHFLGKATYHGSAPTTGGDAFPGAASYRYEYYIQLATPNEVPLVFIRPYVTVGGAWMDHSSFYSVLRVGVSGTACYITVVSSGGTSNPCQVLVFSTAKNRNPSGDHGIVVYRADSSVAFDSRLLPLNVRNAVVCKPPYLPTDGGDPSVVGMETVTEITGYGQVYYPPGWYYVGYANPMGEDYTIVSATPAPAPTYWWAEDQSQIYYGDGLYVTVPQYRTYQREVKYGWNDNTLDIALSSNNTYNPYSVNNLPSKSNIMIAAPATAQAVWVRTKNGYKNSCGYGTGCQSHWSTARWFGMYHQGYRIVGDQLHAGWIVWQAGHTFWSYYQGDSGFAGTPIGSSSGGSTGTTTLPYSQQTINWQDNTVIIASAEYYD